MKHVIIVGAGALGSHVALFGRNWDAKLVVVDFDRVEQKNTQSQFHTVMGLRQNKAQALKMAMQGMFRIPIKPMTNKLTVDNVEVLLKDSDLVLDCTDNAAARWLIQGFCKNRDIPCLHGSLSADGTFGRVMWTELFALDQEDEEGQATCEDGENLPFHGFVGSVMAMTAQAFLNTGQKRSYHLFPGGLTRLA